MSSSPIPATAPGRLNKAEAARRLGLRVEGVNDLIASGDLKVIDLPIRVKAIILESSVNDLIARMNGEPIAEN